MAGFPPTSARPILDIDIGTSQRSTRVPLALMIAMIAGLLTLASATPSSAQGAAADVVSADGLVSHALVPRTPGTNEAQTIVRVRVTDPTVNAIRVQTLAGNTVVRSRVQSVGGARPSTVSIRSAIPVTATVHEVVVSTLRNGVATELERWVDLVAGDVIVVQGQSNARATHGTLGIGLSPFIRTFGSNAITAAPSAADREWHLADPNGTGPVYGPGQVGKWGFEMARQLVARHDTPIALVNGAHGGRPISFFQRDDADSDNIDTNYGRLLQRLNAAGITDDVRSILWYQGEAERRPDPTVHRPGFETLVADWRQDFPRVQQVYVTQIHQGCSDFPSDDAAHLIVRYAQHQLTLDRADLTLLSTSAAPGHDGCHYNNAGYEELGVRAFRAVSRDLYGGADTEGTAAPSPHFARFNNAARTSIDVFFIDANDRILAQAGVGSDLVIGGQLATVTNVAGDRGRIRLTLASPAAANATVAYRAWGPTWLTNTKGVGAAAFELSIASFGSTRPQPTQAMLPFSYRAPRAAASCWATRTGNNIAITWTPGNNNNATRHIVRRSRALSDHSWAASVSAPGRRWTNSNLAADSYLYTVTAVNALGQSNARTCGPGIVIVPSQPGLAAPASCQAVAAGGSTIGITWATSAGAVDYVIRRSRNGGTFFWTGRNAGTSFTDSGVRSGTYTYSVAARANGATSAPTVCAGVITL